MYVYERVLEWDLDYFEGGKSGVVIGDVVFWLIVEVEDVGDIVYFLLYVREIMCFVLIY